MMGTVMGFAGGLGGAASTMANVLTFTQGVVFKPQDILVKFFALVALQTEVQVEIAANTMTLNAIKALGDPRARRMQGRIPTMSTRAMATRSCRCGRMR